MLFMFIREVMNLNGAIQRKRLNQQTYWMYVPIIIKNISYIYFFVYIFHNSYLFILNFEYIFLNTYIFSPCYNKIFQVETCPPISYW